MHDNHDEYLLLLFRFFSFFIGRLNSRLLGICSLIHRLRIVINNYIDDDASLMLHLLHDSIV